MDRSTQNLYRKEAIEATLLELMTHVPFEKITVVDIAQKMGISRKCFYSYFDGKLECMESLMDRFILDAAMYVERGRTPETPITQRYILNLEYWKGRCSFLEALDRSGLEDMFFQRCMNHLLTLGGQLGNAMQTDALPFDEDVLHFCLSGQLSLLLRWCRRGFEPDMEEMAAKYMRLLQQPLIAEGFFL